MATGYWLPIPLQVRSDCFLVGHRRQQVLYWTVAGHECSWPRLGQWLQYESAFRHSSMGYP